MATGTALSRATGLVRTVALASALGVSAAADAYNTANTAPLMIYTLVAGGVLTSALVPLLVRAEHDDRQQREVASVLLGTGMAVAVTVSLVSALAAPAVMRVLTLGARGRPGYGAFLDLGTTWLRMFSPQVAAYALSVLAVGIMTARGRLALGSFAPVTTNVITVAAAASFAALGTGTAVASVRADPTAVALLGWGTTLGVVAMALLQLVGATRSEPGLRFRVTFRHPAVRELGSMARWMILYVVVNQIGLAAVVSMANTVVGGVTAYQWAFMLMQLPYAIVAVSLYTAALPAIARAAAGEGDVSETVAGPLRSTLTLLLPAAAGLWLLANPVSAALVGRAGAPLVAAAVGGFAVSLIPFSVFQLLTRISYGFKDTRTPAVVNIAVNAVNIGVDALVLLGSQPTARRIAGLAVGHAASYVVGCALLGRRLHRQGAIRPRQLLEGTRWLVPAVGLMVAVLTWFPGRTAISANRVGSALSAAALAALGASVFGIAAIVGGARPGRRTG